MVVRARQSFQILRQISGFLKTELCLIFYTRFLTNQFIKKNFKLTTQATLKPKVEKLRTKYQILVVE